MQTCCSESAVRDVSLGWPEGPTLVVVRDKFDHGVCAQPLGIGKRGHSEREALEEERLFC